MRIKKLTFLAAVFAFGFLAVGNVAHSDTITINQTASEGLKGIDFVPSEFFGTGKNCVANPGFTSLTAGDGCTNHANHALNAWLNGKYFDPRNGTAMIPPSGDHHRSGWRLMMEDSFSAGAFLTGFAPFLNEFPNFPQVGTAGPSSGFGDKDLLLLFLDHHGEPLTPGRFPRYIPAERQAWADTLMVKYVSSSGGQFSQSLRSHVGQFRSGTLPGNAATVTWMSMSDENADGCSPGNCIWTFDTVNGVSGDGDDILSRSSDGGTTIVLVTTQRRTASFNATGGDVDVTVTMTPIEKVPTVIDDRMDQNMKDVGGAGLQVLRYQFQVVSGPNVAGEEGSDPYTWVICGSRAANTGEKNCAAGLGAGIIDEDVDFAYKATTLSAGANAVYSFAERMGPDGRFFTSDDGANTIGGTKTIVACHATLTGTYTTLEGSEFPYSTCDSDPGADLVYGTSDDVVIYYREAVEAGFRSGTRENRATSFSFLDAQSQLRQIMEQDIGFDSGFLASCLNCNGPAGEHDALLPIGPLTYDQIWPEIPDITLGPHPPLPTDVFLVTP